LSVHPGSNDSSLQQFVDRYGRGPISHATDFFLCSYQQIGFRLFCSDFGETVITEDPQHHVSTVSIDMVTPFQYWSMLQGLGLFGFPRGQILTPGPIHQAILENLPS
jgi:hypothetical protein